MSPETLPDWSCVALADLIASLDAGVSVNSEGRPCYAGEIGVLKTSSVGGGRFNPSEHKAVLDDERARVRVPVRADSIVLSRMNTPDLVGENAYVEADQPHLFLPDRLWLLKTNDRADCRWLSFYMQSELFRNQIDDIATGTSGSMKNISKGRLADLSIFLPSIDEQRRIAQVLRAADVQIAAQESVVAKLRDIQNASFAEFLKSGDSDPSAQPVTSWTTGRIAGVAKLPDGWTIERLVNVARLESGHTPSRHVPAYWEGGNTEWISLHDTQNLERPEITSTELKITEDGLKNSSARLLPKGTVCFSRTATVGKCVIMGKPMATSQDFANFVCSPKLNNKYLLYLLRWMQPTWKQLSSGSTHKTIYMPTFKSLQIVLPPRPAQDTIADAMDALTAAIDEGVATLAQFRRCKVALTADLLSGRARVPA
jgi:type I restriction enzyme, S subunit